MHLVTTVLLAALAATSQSPPVAVEKPVVLFVCEHGAAKSAIAAAWFDRLARERGLPHRAKFAGSAPEAALSPATREGLTRDGFDVRSWTPVAVTEQDVAAASHVVVFACPLPGRARAALKVIDWNDVKAVSDGYDAARDDIRARVERLIDQVSASRH